MKKKRCRLCLNKRRIHQWGISSGSLMPCPRCQGNKYPLRRTIRVLLGRKEKAELWPVSRDGGKTWILADWPVIKTHRPQGVNGRYSLWKRLKERSGFRLAKLETTYGSEPSREIKLLRPPIRFQK